MDIGRRDFSTGVDRWQLCYAKVNCACALVICELWQSVIGLVVMKMMPTYRHLHIIPMNLTLPFMTEDAVSQ